MVKQAEQADELTNKFIKNLNSLGIPTNQSEITINDQPLFKIEGLDINGNVRIKTNIIDKSEKDLAFNEYIKDKKSTDKPINNGRNAYDIRLEILQSAMQYLMWQNSYNNTPNACITTDVILDTANKLYKFVENKK